MCGGDKAQGRAWLLGGDGADECMTSGEAHSPRPLLQW